MIEEQLFRAPSDTMATGQPTNPVTVSSISCSFTEVEENVIYYTSGCVIKKLLHQYKKHSGETTEDLKYGLSSFVVLASFFNSSISLPTDAKHL